MIDEQEKVKEGNISKIEGWKLGGINRLGCFNLFRKLAF